MPNFFNNSNHNKNNGSQNASAIELRKLNLPKAVLNSPDENYKKIIAQFYYQQNSRQFDNPEEKRSWTFEIYNRAYNKEESFEELFDCLFKPEFHLEFSQYISHLLSQENGIQTFLSCCQKIEIKQDELVALFIIKLADKETTSETKQNILKFILAYKVSDDFSEKFNRLVGVPLSCNVLHCVVASQDPEIIKSLIIHLKIHVTEYIEEINEHYVIPLSLASQAPTSKIMEILIKAVEKEINEPETFKKFLLNSSNLYFILKRINMEIFEILKKYLSITKIQFFYHHKHRFLHLISGSDDVDVLKEGFKLFNKRKKILDFRKNTILHYAATSSNPEVLKFVLENFDETEMRELCQKQNDEGENPLHCLKSKEMVELFLQKLGNEISPFFTQENKQNQSALECIARISFEAAKPIVDKMHVSKPALHQKILMICLIIKNDKHRAFELFTSICHKKNENWREELFNLALKHSDDYTLMMACKPLNATKILVLMQKFQEKDFLANTLAYKNITLMEVFLRKLDPEEKELFLEQNIFGAFLYYSFVEKDKTELKKARLKLAKEVLIIHKGDQSAPGKAILKITLSWDQITDLALFLQALKDFNVDIKREKEYLQTSLTFSGVIKNESFWFEFMTYITSAESTADFSESLESSDQQVVQPPLPTNGHVLQP